jgi:hypothetical protein
LDLLLATEIPIRPHFSMGFVSNEVAFSLLFLFSTSALRLQNLKQTVNF